MEFFRLIKTPISEKGIQEFTDFNNLEAISNELFVIGDQNQTEAEIGGLWGEFTLIRNEIRGGVRFALKECPNALAWTITTGFSPDPEAIVIHLTINRQEKEASFLEEVEEFLDDHCKCIEKFLAPQLALEQN
ncbi:hypothetical protein [Salinimicrobium soli]|uniref:hypothetical protein n=1 Tax=Salinimicrobium soli TaxID=1254399 RepID=UPI003AACB9DE